MFSEIKEEELLDINGDGLAGAVVGYVGGLTVGIGVGIYKVSKCAGDTSKVRSDVFTSTVGAYTILGTVLGATTNPF